MRDDINLRCRTTIIGFSVHKTLEHHLRNDEQIGKGWFLIKMPSASLLRKMTVQFCSFSKSQIENM